MDVKINGDLLSIMLLYSLLSTYENFLCAIEYREEVPAAEVLKLKIIEESEARNQSNGNSVIAIAAGILSRGGFKIRCYKCGAVQLSVAPRVGQNLNVELKNTLFVPDLKLHLVSVTKSQIRTTL